MRRQTRRMVIIEELYCWSRVMLAIRVATFELLEGNRTT